MTNSINNAIPFVPENTIDPAAGLNDAINTIDVLLQLAVTSVGANTPPAGVEGQRHIVGTAPTGAWAGQANKIARYLDAAWNFYDARYALSLADGQIYVRTGSTWAAYASAFTGGTLTSALNEAPIVTLASAATVNIGAAAANTINISGTTTITAFDSIAAGAVRRVVFQGALTLTHNGTSLILPTSANITTAAGDAAEFVSLGSGNWRCFNYQRTDGTTPALGPANSPTFTALTLSNGQIVFPATQVPSANSNTLDDYEEGTWTPVLTFATPGDLSVTYSEQSGFYTKIGWSVVLEMRVTTSSFTHSTASGNLTITGSPFTTTIAAGGACAWQGITKAGYTDAVFVRLTSGSIICQQSGDGLSISTVSAVNMPSGGTVSFRGGLNYHV